MQRYNAKVLHDNFDRQLKISITLIFFNYSQ